MHMTLLKFWKSVVSFWGQRWQAWGWQGITAMVLCFFLAIAPAEAVDYNKRSMTNHDFSGQDLTDSSFDLASLKGSDFSHADVQGVRFFSANLEDTNFEGANLRGAVLDSARLSRANFQDAILEGAFMASIKFSNTNFNGADFTDALLLPKTEQQLCGIVSGTNPTTGRNTIDTLYCP